MKTTGRVPHVGAAVVVALLLGARPVPAAAAGDHDGCTGFIDEVPVVILTPGTWCLRSDLAFAVDIAEIAIDVQADGVTIDCHDRRLVGKVGAYPLPRWAIVSYKRATTDGGVVARAGGGGSAWGIQVSDADGPALANVVGNRIRDVVPDGPSGIGIRNVSTGPVTIADNVLFGAGAGTGISCTNTKGAVRGNSVLRFATGLSGCPSDGGNVVRN